MTFLEPKGGEKPVSLSFESGGATKVSGFTSHGLVCPQITEDSLKWRHNFLCQARLGFGKYLRAGCVYLFGSRSVHGGLSEQSKCLHCLVSANEVGGSKS